MIGRLGIGGRLFLAFLAIALLSSASALIGWLGLRDVARTQATVVSRAMPTMADAHGIAALSARLVSDMSALARSEDADDREARAAALRDQAVGLREGIARLDAAVIGAGTLADIDATVGDLVANIDRLDALVAERIALAQRYGRGAERALDAAVGLTALSETLVSNASSGASAVVSNLYGLIEAPGDREPAYDALDRLIEEDIYLMERMFELRLRSSQVGLLLNQLGRVQRADDIDGLERDHATHLRVLVRRVGSIADPVRREQAEAMLGVLREGAASGADGLFGLRRRLSAIRDELAALETRSGVLAAALGDRVDGLVTSTGAFAAASGASAEDAVRTGLVSLVVATAATLVISGLIVWLYVERRVVARIGVLAATTRRLAEGRLDAAVNTEGTDELADMARAVQFFKDEAHRKRELEDERERVNAELRAHREELQRLVDERTAQLTDANARLREEVARHAEARDRAEAASRAKSEFLATMSHEIRTPMSGMLGMLRILGDSGLEDAQRRHLALASASGETLLAILNDILDYSKIESGRIDIRPAAFDLGALAEGLVALMRPVAREKGLAMELRIDPALPARLCGDQGKIRQVLLNLIGNAVKFTERGGVAVEIEGAPGEGDRYEARAIVRDTGIGIPEAGLAVIFEPFAQLDASIARRHGGTGLGLAICRRLVEAMGGSIRVTSVPGAGSRFTVALPLTRSAETEGHAPDGAASPRRDDVPLCVLLVEDSEVNQIVVRTYLERMGHAVELVADGRAAVEAVAGGRFDLVVMDISLPGMDGIAATRAIRDLPDADRHGVPIVAMSAHVFADQIEQHFAAGMNAFVGKPVFPETLGAAIDAAIDGHGRRVFLERDGEGLPDAKAASIEGSVLRDDYEALGHERTAEIVVLFFRSAPDQVRRLEAAIAAGDIGQARVMAHQVRSASASLGLFGLTRAAAAIEDAARGGDAAALDRLGAELPGAYERSAATLRRTWDALASSVAE